MPIKEKNEGGHMLEVSGLKKNYHKTEAVKGVDFKIVNGEVVIILGPNGAGKSTVIKCIAGLLRYEGNILINGVKNKTLEAKKNLGYVPEVPSLYELLTVKEHVDFVAKAYDIKGYEEKAEALYERFDLLDKKDKLGKELSKGMQQKVSIICGLITNPQLILFDEPMMGLDPKAIKELKNLILELRDSGVAIIISTHIIDSVVGLWDKALIMKDGDIIYERTKKELIENDETLEEVFFSATGI